MATLDTKETFNKLVKLNQLLQIPVRWINLSKITWCKNLKRQVIQGLFLKNHLYHHLLHCDTCQVNQMDMVYGFTRPNQTRTTTKLTCCHLLTNVKIRTAPKSMYLMLRIKLTPHWFRCLRISMLMRSSRLIRCSSCWTKQISTCVKPRKTDSST